MGGWFLDIFIEYLVRVVVGVIKTRGKDAWPVVKATVAESYCPAAGFGCPVAEVYYEYVVDGKLYTGIHQKAFIFLSSGEHYVRQLAPGADLSVRLNPGNPAASIALERDQTLVYTVDTHTM